MPRAATSVATRTSARPLRNASSAVRRCACDRLPWMTTDEMPSSASWRLTRSLPCFVRQNKMSDPHLSTSSATAPRRRSRGTMRTMCSMFGASTAPLTS